MKPKRVRDLIVDVWGVLLIVPFLMVPFIDGGSLLRSVTHQILIGLTAALGVYIMLRMRLLSFTVPAFMAIGGYAAAMLATSGITNLLVLMAAAFIFPMLAAIPLGFLVLRLKGVYFIFFTFILNEVFQVAIFETPGLTGGSDGIAGLPPATLFGLDLGTPRMLVLVTVMTALVAAAITLAVTHRYRAEFSAIEENEPLAESLGVAVWWYRTIGFLASAGVSGLAGFALVHQLATAHPSSFASFSAIDYVAYAIVGGSGTLLGPVVGAMLLVTMSNLFSSQGLYAAALFGILLISAVMLAPEGIVGGIRRLFEKRRMQAKPHGIAEVRAMQSEA
ncbi:MAG: branched-chain amino acid ABC transporter permease [Nitrospiraceae bacterium]|nr:branched-chain amino acid ABC transporter permease [Nitrospiraceae bacterium]